MSEIPHVKFLSGEDPMGIIIAIGMMFVLLYWFTQGSSVNAIGGNSTITAAYNRGYTNTSWLLWIVFSPFALLIVVNSLAHRMREDDVHLESMGDEEEHSTHGLEGVLSRFDSRLDRTRRRRGIKDVISLAEEGEDEG